MTPTLRAFILHQLRQPATWRGISLLVASIGHWASVDYATQQQLYLDLGIGFAGLIGAIWPARMPGEGRATDRKTGHPK